MKKTYKIEVDCANCANKMEEAAKKTAGVKTATVNFMTQKGAIKTGKDADFVLLDEELELKGTISFGEMM